MSFLGRTYSFVKQENFEGFLKAVGAPEERIEHILKFSPDQKLVKDGDTYTHITATTAGPSETKFKSGVQFEDLFGPEKFPMQSVWTVEGNTVIQKIIGSPEQGTATFKKEYIGDDLIVTITSNIWDGVAKRFYKAA